MDILKLYILKREKKMSQMTNLVFIKVSKQVIFLVEDGQKYGL